MQILDIIDVRQRTQMRKIVITQFLVDFKQHYCIAVSSITTEVHIRDIDATLRGRGTNVTDNTGLVIISDVKHVFAEFRLQWNSLDVDHARPVLNQRAANTTRLSFGLNANGNPAGIFITALVVRLDHVDVAVARDFAGINRINVTAVVLEDRLHHLHR